MPPPSDRARLTHMVEAIDLLAEFVAGMDYASFLEDRKTQLSVERLLEILGEAANHISLELQSQYPHIPWRQITDLRNVVSHQYFRIRTEIIWEVATADVPPLREQLEQILADLDAARRNQ